MSVNYKLANKLQYNKQKIIKTIILNNLYNK